MPVGMVQGILLNFFKAIYIFSGLLIATIALLIWMNRRRLRIASDGWFSSKNTLILATDMIWGISIAIIVLVAENYITLTLYHWIIVMLIVSHAYRFFETRIRHSAAFNWNQYLVISNNIKLYFLIALEILSLVVITFLV